MSVSYAVYKLLYDEARDNVRFKHHTNQELRSRDCLHDHHTYIPFHTYEKQLYTGYLHKMK